MQAQYLNNKNHNTHAKTYILFYMGVTCMLACFVKILDNHHFAGFLSILYSCMAGNEKMPMLSLILFTCERFVFLQLPFVQSNQKYNAKNKCGDC